MDNDNPNQTPQQPAAVPRWDEVVFNGSDGGQPALPTPETSVSTPVSVQAETPAPPPVPVQAPIPPSRPAPPPERPMFTPISTPSPAETTSVRPLPALVPAEAPAPPTSPAGSSAKLPKQVHLAQTALRKYKALDKRVSIGAAVVVGVLLVGGIGHGVLSSNQSDAALGTSNIQVVTDAGAPVSSSKDGKMHFTPVAPINEQQLAHLDPKNSFSAANNSYTFSDMFLGTPVIVTEQPVVNSSDLQTAAQQLNTNASADTKSGTAYINDNVLNGQQKLVFQIHGLLVFVQSDYHHEPSVWVTYLNSLK